MSRSSEAGEGYCEGAGKNGRENDCINPDNSPSTAVLQGSAVPEEQGISTFSILQGPSATQPGSPGRFILVARADEALEQQAA